jgi:hypothetical protein
MVNNHTYFTVAFNHGNMEVPPGLFFIAELEALVNRRSIDDIWAQLDTLREQERTQKNIYTIAILANLLKIEDGDFTPPWANVLLAMENIRVK